MLADRLCHQRLQVVCAVGNIKRRLRHRSTRTCTQSMAEPLDASHSFEVASVELQQLCASITHYSESHPTVTGSERLLKRAQSDLAFVRKLRDVATGADTFVSGRHREEQLQGLLNNVRGMKAELAVAQQAPAVVSLGSRFYAEVAAGEVNPQSQSKRKQTKAAGLANHFVPSGDSVEVDVVAQQGLAWIEVKAYEPFDLNSTHWLGNPGHFKGLEQQAQQQLCVAQSQCQQLIWQQPAVVFHFPQGVHTDVQAQLQEMGVLVSGPGELCESVLPPMPPVPAICNLDVTTMCALVSEVSNGDPSRPLLQQWAQRVTHWKECLAAEFQVPMLPMLEPVLADKDLIAAEAAVVQFEKLLSEFGGNLEQSRWKDLKSRLIVFSNAQPAAAISDVQSQSQYFVRSDKEFSDRCALSSKLRTCILADSRVDALQAISDAQKAVFALGDLQRAKTLTANGRATEFAARQGVKLEVFVHRAVWLTGM